MRIIVFIITAVIQLAAATVGLVTLLLALNGFSEAQATPGLILFIAIGLGSAIGLGVASAFVAKRLVERKSLGSIAAAAIAVVGLSVLGMLILIAGFFVAVMAAEVMRGMK